MLLIGFSINISNASPGVKYFGTFFCVTGSYAAFPGVVSWLGNNLAGQYKRGVGRAPLHTRHGIMLMFVGIGFVTIPIILLTYRRINRARDEAAARPDVVKLSVKQLRELGDRAPDFRYMY
ncbi:hypothetical protein EDB83DRAFT_2524528 [Lactarius deliciosus]|nr:hypothetical protein EDB83DRAFT_2604068 [Lactarius deliciosus]KAH9038692.1 hypothetical protein EDB83DRAFT_2524528 [Lactarius deliciosus]